MPVFLSDYCGLYIAVACKVNEKITFCAVAAKSGKTRKKSGHETKLLRANSLTS